MAATARRWAACAAVAVAAQAGGAAGWMPLSARPYWVPAEGGGEGRDLVAGQSVYETNFDQIMPVLLSLGSLSLVGAVLVACVFAYSRDIQRDHASRLILIITCCDVAYTFKFMLASVAYLVGATNSQDSFNFIPDACLTSTAWGQFFGMAIISWNACWIFDFLCVLQNPLRNTAHQRRWYHLFVWSLSVATAIYATVITSQADASGLTCWTRADASVGLVLDVPLYVYLALAVGSIFYASYRLGCGVAGMPAVRRTLFLCHLAYVVAFVILWALPVAHALYDPHALNFSLTMVDVITMAAQGFIFAWIRLSQPGAWGVLVSILDGAVIATARALNRVFPCCRTCAGGLCWNYSLAFLLCCGCRCNPRDMRMGVPAPADMTGRYAVFEDDEGGDATGRHASVVGSELGTLRLKSSDEVGGGGGYDSFDGASHAASPRHGSVAGSAITIPPGHSVHRGSVASGAGGNGGGGGGGGRHAQPAREPSSIAVSAGGYIGAAEGGGGYHNPLLAAKREASTVSEVDHARITISASRYALKRPAGATDREPLLDGARPAPAAGREGSGVLSAIRRMVSGAGPSSGGGSSGYLSTVSGGGGGGGRNGSGSAGGGGAGGSGEASEHAAASRQPLLSGGSDGGGIGADGGEPAGGAEAIVRAPTPTSAEPGIALTRRFSPQPLRSRGSSGTAIPAPPLDGLTTSFISAGAGSGGDVLAGVPDSTRSALVAPIAVPAMPAAAPDAVAATTTTTATAAGDETAETAAAASAPVAAPQTASPPLLAAAGGGEAASEARDVVGELRSSVGARLHGMHGEEDVPVDVMGNVEFDIGDLLRARNVPPQPRADAGAARPLSVRPVIQPFVSARHSSSFWLPPGSDVLDSTSSVGAEAGDTGHASSPTSAAGAAPLRLQPPRGAGTDGSSSSASSATLSPSAASAGPPPTAAVAAAAAPAAAAAAGGVPPAECGARHAHIARGVSSTAMAGKSATGWDSFHTLRLEESLCMLSGLCQAVLTTEGRQRLGFPLRAGAGWGWGGEFKDAGAWLRDPGTTTLELPLLHQFNCEEYMETSMKKDAAILATARAFHNAKRAAAAATAVAAGGGGAAAADLAAAASAAAESTAAAAAAARAGLSADEVSALAGGAAPLMLHTRLATFRGQRFEFCSLADESFFAIRASAALFASQIVYALDPTLLSGGLLRAHFSEGASSSFFCRSLDQQLVVKTISEGEVKELMRLLPAYHAHLAANPDSLLCRIYGCFSMKQPSSARVYFLLMGNVFPITELGPLSLTFDLKGSTVGRRARVSKSVVSRTKDGRVVSQGMLYQDMEFRERFPFGLVPCNTDLASVARLATSMGIDPSGAGSGGGGSGGGGARCAVCSALRDFSAAAVAVAAAGVGSTGSEAGSDTGRGGGGGDDVTPSSLDVTSPSPHAALSPPSTASGAAAAAAAVPLSTSSIASTRSTFGATAAAGLLIGDTATGLARARAIVEQIRADATLLSAYGLMDYSLLIHVQPVDILDGPGVSLLLAPDALGGGVAVAASDGHTSGTDCYYHSAAHANEAVGVDGEESGFGDVGGGGGGGGSKAGSAYDVNFRFTLSFNKAESFSLADCVALARAASYLPDQIARFAQVSNAAATTPGSRQAVPIGAITRWSRLAVSIAALGEAPGAGGAGDSAARSGSTGGGGGGGGSGAAPAATAAAAAAAGGGGRIAKFLGGLSRASSTGSTDVHDGSGGGGGAAGMGVEALRSPSPMPPHAAGAVGFGAAGGSSSVPLSPAGSSALPPAPSPFVPVTGGATASPGAPAPAGSPPAATAPRAYSQRAVIQVGIIDMLQTYDVGKKMENTFKMLRHAIGHANLGADISSIPPEPYHARFMRFVERIFLPAGRSGAAWDEPLLRPEATAPGAAAPTPPTV